MPFRGPAENTFTISLAKNAAHMHTLFALANLVIAKRALLA